MVMASPGPVKIFDTEEEYFQDDWMRFAIQRVLSLHAAELTGSPNGHENVFLSGFADTSKPLAVVHLQLLLRRLVTTGQHTTVSEPPAAAAAQAAGAAAPAPGALAAEESAVAGEGDGPAAGARPAVEGPAGAGTADPGPAAAAASSPEKAGAGAGASTSLPNGPLEAVAESGDTAAAGAAAVGERPAVLARGPEEQTRAPASSDIPPATTAGQAAGQAGGRLQLAESLQVLSGSVEGSSVDTVSVRLTFSRSYLVYLATPCSAVTATATTAAAGADPDTSAAAAGPSISAPGASSVAAAAGGGGGISAESGLAAAASVRPFNGPARLDSAAAAGSWAAHYAGELSAGEVDRLRHLDFGLERAALRTLSHTLAAVADWVLAPQVLNTDPSTGLTSGPDSPLLIRLRPWALAVHVNADVQKYGNCVRPSLVYLACGAGAAADAPLPGGGPGAGAGAGPGPGAGAAAGGAEALLPGARQHPSQEHRPDPDPGRSGSRRRQGWSLLEVLKAPPMKHSLAQEVMTLGYGGRHTAPPASGSYTSACRPGWVLPLQRLAALMKRFHGKTDGAWQVSASRLHNRLRPLLEGDLLYGRDQALPQRTLGTLTEQQQQQQPGGRQQTPQPTAAGAPGEWPADVAGVAMALTDPGPGGGGGGGGKANGASSSAGGGGDGGQLPRVEAFLRDLGATKQQVQDVLALDDIDANVGFCALCGNMGDLVACDTCVDSFCCRCLHVRDPEVELPDPWCCSFCLDLRTTAPQPEALQDAGGSTAANTTATIANAAANGRHAHTAPHDHLPAAAPAAPTEPAKARPAAVEGEDEEAERPVRKRGRPPGKRGAGSLPGTVPRAHKSRRQHAGSQTAGGSASGAAARRGPRRPKSGSVGPPAGGPTLATLAAELLIDDLALALQWRTASAGGGSLLEWPEEGSDVAAGGAAGARGAADGVRGGSSWPPAGSRTHAASPEAPRGSASKSHQEAANALMMLTQDHPRGGSLSLPAASGEAQAEPLQQGGQRGQPEGWEREPDEQMEAAGADGDGDVDVGQQGETAGERPQESAHECTRQQQQQEQPGQQGQGQGQAQQTGEAGAAEGATCTGERQSGRVSGGGGGRQGEPGSAGGEPPAAAAAAAAAAGAGAARRSPLLPQKRRLEESSPDTSRGPEDHTTRQPAEAGAEGRRGAPGSGEALVPDADRNPKSSADPRGSESGRGRGRGPGVGVGVGMGAAEASSGQTTAAVATAAAAAAAAALPGSVQTTEEAAVGSSVKALAAGATEAAEGSTPSGGAPRPPPQPAAAVPSAPSGLPPAGTLAAGAVANLNPGGARSETATAAEQAAAGAAATQEAPEPEPAPAAVPPPTSTAAACGQPAASAATHARLATAQARATATARALAAADGTGAGAGAAAGAGAGAGAGRGAAEQSAATSPAAAAAEVSQQGHEEEQLQQQKAGRTAASAAELAAANTAPAATAAAATAHAVATVELAIRTDTANCTAAATGPQVLRAGSDDSGGGGGGGNDSLAAPPLPPGSAAATGGDTAPAPPLVAAASAAPEPTGVSPAGRGAEAATAGPAPAGAVVSRALTVLPPAAPPRAQGAPDHHPPAAISAAAQGSEPPPLQQQQQQQQHQQQHPAVQQSPAPAPPLLALQGGPPEGSGSGGGGGGGGGVLGIDAATLLAFHVMEQAAAHGVDLALLAAWMETIDTALERYVDSPVLQSMVSSCLRGLSRSWSGAPASGSGSNSGHPSSGVGVASQTVADSALRHAMEMLRRALRLPRQQQSQPQQPLPHQQQ